MAFGGPHSSCVRPGAHSARHQGLPQWLDAVSHGRAFRLRRRSRAALRRKARPARPYGYARVVAFRSSLTLPRFPVLLQRGGSWM